MHSEHELSSAEHVFSFLSYINTSTTRSLASVASRLGDSLQKLPLMDFLLPVLGDDEATCRRSESEKGQQGQLSRNNEGGVTLRWLCGVWRWSQAKSSNDDCEELVQSQKLFQPRKMAALRVQRWRWHRRRTWVKGDAPSSASSE